MKIELIFAWYDLWIGLFIDKKKRIIYVFPLPMVGIQITLRDAVKEGCAHEH